MGGRVGRKTLLAVVDTVVDYLMLSLLSYKQYPNLIQGGKAPSVKDHFLALLFEIIV